MMEVAYTDEQLVQITQDLLRKADFREDMYVRPMVYKSQEVLGVRLHDVDPVRGQHLVRGPERRDVVEGAGAGEPETAEAPAAGAAEPPQAEEIDSDDLPF